MGCCESVHSYAYIILRTRPRRASFVQKNHRKNCTVDSKDRYSRVWTSY